MLIVIMAFNISAKMLVLSNKICNALFNLTNYTTLHKYYYYLHSMFASKQYPRHASIN